MLPIPSVSPPSMNLETKMPDENRILSLEEGKLLAELGICKSMFGSCYKDAIEDGNTTIGRCPPCARKLDGTEPKSMTPEQLAAIADPTTICARLRGIYTVPINDGAGLLNGKDTFTRTFDTPPIQQAAANLIETLNEQIDILLVVYKEAIVASDEASLRSEILIAKLQSEIETLKERNATLGWTAEYDRNRAESEEGKYL